MLKIATSLYFRIFKYMALNSKINNENAESASRILFISMDKELGTAMNSTPLYRALREVSPNAKVDVIASPMAKETLLANPYIDHVFTVSSLHPALLFGMIGQYILKPFFRNSYDWVFTTVSCRRRSVALMAALVPTRRRGGHSTPQLLDKYDSPTPYDERISVIANNLLILHALNHAPAGGEPEIYFPAAIPEKVRQLLRGDGVDPDRPIAVLAAQTSGGQPTDWFADRFAQVADGLVDGLGLQPVFVGTQAGAGLIDDIRGRMRHPAATLAGRTGVRDLAALLAGADLAIALDSGAMHVARATRVPMVVIASGWQEPHHWLPLGVETCHIVSGAGDWCRGCTRLSCPQRTCMQRITPDDVLSAAATLLERFPPTSAARAARIAACTGVSRS